MFMSLVQMVNQAFGLEVPGVVPGGFDWSEIPKVSLRGGSVKVES